MDLYWCLCKNHRAKRNFFYGQFSIEYRVCCRQFSMNCIYGHFHSPTQSLSDLRTLQYWLSLWFQHLVKSVPEFYAQSLSSSGRPYIEKKKSIIKCAIVGHFSITHCFKTNVIPYAVALCSLCSPGFMSANFISTDRCFQVLPVLLYQLILLFLEFVQ
jgi:hypothetical protein